MEHTQSRLSSAQNCTFFGLFLRTAFLTLILRAILKSTSADNPYLIKQNADTVLQTDKIRQLDALGPRVKKAIGTLAFPKITLSQICEG